MATTARTITVGAATTTTEARLPTGGTHRAMNTVRTMDKAGTTTIRPGTTTREDPARDSARKTQPAAEEATMTEAPTREAPRRATKTVRREVATVIEATEAAAITPNEVDPRTPTPEVAAKTGITNGPGRHGKKVVVRSHIDPETTERTAMHAATNLEETMIRGAPSEEETTRDAATNQTSEVVAVTTDSAREGHAATSEAAWAVHTVTMTPRVAGPVSTKLTVTSEEVTCAMATALPRAE